MIVLKILSKLIKALRSNESPAQLAWGFALGMIIGLTPFRNLHNLLVVLLLIIFNVNLAMASLAFLAFSLFAYLFDPLFHSLGYWLLVEVDTLRPVWLWMSSTPIVAWSNFNNTVVLSSLVSSLLLLLPLFFFMKWFVPFYRIRLEPRIQQMKIAQLIAGSKLYRLYEKISELGE